MAFGQKRSEPTLSFGNKGNVNKAAPTTDELQEKVEKLARYNVSVVVSVNLETTKEGVYREDIRKVTGKNMIRAEAERLRAFLEACGHEDIEITPFEEAL